MAKKCDLSSGEEDWIFDIFIDNMNNYEIQKKLLTKNSPREALKVALVEEKGISNLLNI